MKEQQKQNTVKACAESTDDIIEEIKRRYIKANEKRCIQSMTSPSGAVLVIGAYTKPPVADGWYYFVPPEQIIDLLEQGWVGSWEDDPYAHEQGDGLSTRHLETAA